MGKIEITTRKIAAHIFIEIADNGCGIDKKIIRQITNPFFTTKPPGEGTGLGLSITYSIVKDHQGTITFESEQGKGTRVILQFPIE